jgi:hypothetical protein
MEHLGAMVAKQLAIRGMLLDSWDTVYHCKEYSFTMPDSALTTILKAGASWSQI